MYSCDSFFFFSLAKNFGSDMDIYYLTSLADNNT